MPRPGHLTAVLEPADPLGPAAARWVRALSDRAGEPVPYAFALALARRHGPPGAAPLRGVADGSPTSASA